MNIERAAQFVDEQGDAVQRARLVALRSGQAAAAVPAQLAAAQNADGGVAFGSVAGRPSALHDTAHALQALNDLQLLSSDTAARALAFIAGRQGRRGIWRETADLAPFDPPLWMAHDNTAADVYTTALCGSTLARFGNDSLRVDRAVTWLQTQQGRDGLLPVFKLHSSWLALPAFTQALDPEARVTKRLVGGLGDALNDEWTGAMLVECLAALLGAGYSTSLALAQRLWRQLQGQQQPNGAVVVDETEDAVEVTLGTIAVVLRMTGQRR